jgi:hypothetical protein
MCWFGHIDSRCDHVLISYIAHSIEFGFECVIDQTIYFMVVTHVLGMSKFKCLRCLCIIYVG